jgi:DNA-directed RNA polymerase alpha subunit
MFRAADLSAFPTQRRPAIARSQERRPCALRARHVHWQEDSIAIHNAMPQAEPSSEPLLDADIAILGLSLRASNVLRRHDLHTVRDVTRVSPRKLFVMTRLGRRSVAQIASSVERRGLRLADDGMGGPQQQLQV